MATEVADDTELTPATGPFSGRMSNIAMAIGGAGLVAFLAAGGLFVASYNGSHKAAPQPSAPSIVASAPAPAPEPPAAPAPDPASTMFSTPPTPAARNSTAALASKTAGTLPDFSLPTIDWPTFDAPSTGWPTVDWQAVLTAPAQAQNANSAANIFSAIIGAASGTVGWIGNGTATVVGDLLLASAYNGGGNGTTDSLTSLLTGLGTSPQAPDLMAALRTLPPPPDLTKLPSLSLPAPPDLTKLAPLALALPPPPDLTKLPPLTLPPPPDLTGLLFALPPPPSIGLPSIGFPSLHLWPFF